MAKLKLVKKISDPKGNKNEKTREEGREEGTLSNTWQERQKCPSH